MKELEDTEMGVDDVGEVEEGEMDSGGGEPQCRTLIKATQIALLLWLGRLNVKLNAKYTLMLRSSIWQR